LRFYTTDVPAAVRSASTSIALTPRIFCQEKTVPPSIILSLAFALLLWAPFAAAQSNVGELLDAGAKKLSAEEFKEELVQRMIVGPTLSGGNLEVMYATTGALAGIGSYAGLNLSVAPISGELTIEDNGKICTSMRMGTGGGASPGQGVTLPSRCQFWFKYADQYFLADSDSDRRARVLRRTVKQ
jgi:hypothetical protein